MNESECAPPDGTLDEQIEQYRRMTGGQRIAIALEKGRIAREAAEARVRQSHPHLSDPKVRTHMRRLIDLSRELEVDIDKLPLSVY